ncbi:hypothetical protein MUU46_18240 [Scandinavium sp. TWS1a]|uniref:hypothetical protein n=1 Tax=Scandinavium tedordense TaxID=2926521 RepID=UPI002165425F|nr:hypothetical protein [Scandinavium tedordense]MCS2172230.1 hypothetical protein [Scandinavium tedordense]
MLINIRKGIERLACVAAALSIIIGFLIAMNSISDGYWGDAKIGFYFAFYGAIFFIYGSQVLLWVVYGFSGQKFEFKLNPINLLR